ncbi:MAG: cyclic nucleotide-binding domain-containing protein, partial [Gemmatimonadetes bacterium]|nr:cyclic nucleotide-binding domain-containing protein [Gemmatimonadota bacterium]
PFDRVLYLKTLPGVSDLKVGELAVLARQSRERFFKKGEVLLKEGEEIQSVFLLVEGRVRVEKDGGVEMMAGPQDDVGTIHFLARSEGGVSAVAEADTLALEIPTAALLEILEDHFSIFLSFIRSFATLVYEHLLETPDGARKSIWSEDLHLPDRPLDLVEKMVLLRRSHIFNDVSLETIAQLASSMQQTTFAAGHRIWSAGEPADEVQLILRGTVQCEVEKTGNVFTAAAGYPLGNIESMAQQRRWYDAVAQTEVTVLRGNASRFVDAMEDQFDFAMTFLTAMAAGYLSYLRQSSVPIPSA